MTAHKEYTGGKSRKAKDAPPANYVLRPDSCLQEASIVALVVDELPRLDQVERVALAALLLGVELETLRAWLARMEARV